MTKEELKEVTKNAVLNIAVMILQDGAENPMDLVENYVEQMMGDLRGINKRNLKLFILMQSMRLADNKEFKARVKVKREEFVDTESGEIVSITTTTIV